jgi:hypothetical protein
MDSVSIDLGGSRGVKLNDDEAKLLDEISFEMPQKRVTLKPKAARPSPFAKRAAGPSQRAPEMDSGLDDFMNPGKQTARAPPPPEEFDGGEEDMDDGFEDQQDPNQPGGGVSTPSEGYATVEDEKADLLNKITRLNKKGIASSQRLTIYSDIEEVRTEYKRMTYSIEVERSIKFQRRMLVACVTGLEFLNDKFDPFDLELNGWSQNCMENVEDYDGVFEELYNKYKAKVQVAPEVKLIMMVGGSAMMFHLTNSMFKAAVPNVSQVMKQNPELMRNMVDAVQRSAPGGFGSPVEGAGQPPSQGLRRDMRGPGLDIGSLMGMMGPPQPVMTRPGVARDDDSVSDIVSVDAGDPDTREVNVSSTGTRGRKSKKKEVQI